MHPCRVLIPTVLAACLLTAAAHACPDHGAAAAAGPAKRLAPTARAHSIVAWKPQAWRPVASMSGHPGLRVAIDPVDGTLSMPLDDGTSAAARIEAELPPLPTVIHPDGSVQMVLDDRFNEYAVAHLDAAGKPAWTCVKSPTGVQQFLRRPAAVPVAPVAPAVKWEVE